MNSVILSKKIRIESLKMVHKAKSSHIGSALSITDLLSVLYQDFLNIDPANPKNENRDRFILSKGHACSSLYALLALKGFFKAEQLMDYGSNGSILMNHVSHKVPGVEFSTGALGHGLQFGLGKALAAKMNKKNWRTIVLLSDGEMDEGSNWESLMFAAHHNLSNLISIIDYNKLQSLDTTENTLGLEPLIDKLESFNCFVQKIDGHNHNSIKDALENLSNLQPNVIIADTIKGKGVSFMENKVQWHYTPPNDEELNNALMELQ
jgi:transketolase